MEQGHNTSTDDYQREYREYKIRTLKITGGIQIDLGILCGILSLTGVVIAGIRKSVDCSYTYRPNNYGNWNCPHYMWNANPLLEVDIMCFILSGWVSCIFSNMLQRERNCLNGSYSITPPCFGLESFKLNILYISCYLLFYVVFTEWEFSLFS